MILTTVLIALALYLKPHVDKTDEGDYLLWYNSPKGRTYLKII